jgi:transcription antitermination factor NusG
MLQIAQGLSVPQTGGSKPVCATDLHSSAQWFAVYTTPRHEKCIGKYFTLKGIEHFLPLYRSAAKWNNGSRVLLELPLFPSYIFVRIRRTACAQVLEVPGVLTIVGRSAYDPVPLPDQEIDALRSGLATRHAEPHPLLKVGQRVCIRSGALSGMEGVLMRRENGLRVVLTLDLILQSVSVTVDETELQPLDSMQFFNR